MEVRSLGAGQLIVEVVAVGTELLIGQIVNSNAATIGRRLAEQGFDAHFQVTVGDNLSRLLFTLRQAHQRADAVVITGGIGPTQDDLTRQALCDLAGRPMVREAEHAAWIEERIRSSRGTVSENVLRMADLPAGAEGLANANGVALGVALEHRGKWLFAMPGVPAEMLVMLDQEVLPRLRRISGAPTVLLNRVLRTWGLGESQVAERLDDLFATTNPSVAFLISDMEVQVRISAKAPDRETARQLIEPVEREVRERLGEAVFGSDADRVEDMIRTGLSTRHWTVATVEHATLGQIGARLAPALGPAFRGAIIPPPGEAEPSLPAADVLLLVGEIGDDTTARRTTRAVVMEVRTPVTTTGRTFNFGGDDERLRSFAVIAGLHMIRQAIESA